MAAPWQKYKLTGEWEGEFTVNNAEQLDEMLEDIYAFLSQSPLGTSDDAFDFSELFTSGGLLYADATTFDLARLANVATGQALLSGGVSANPLWGQINLTTTVTGVLPIANGGTATSTVFTQGSVIFAGASGVYSQDNAGLFFDASNDRLGIGVASPTNALDVRGSSTIAGIYNSSSTAFAALRFFEGTTLASSVQGIASNFGTVGRRSDLELVTLSSAGDITFRPNDTEVLRADSSTVTIPSGKTLTLAGLTATRVLFAGTGGVVSDDSALLWDSTNNWLGIGVTPSQALDIVTTRSTDQAVGMRVDAFHTTATGGTVYGGRYDATITHTSGSMNATVGLTLSARYAATGTGTANSMSGAECFICLDDVASPLGTITTAQGLNLSAFGNFASGTPAVTVSQLRGLIVQNLGSGNGVNGLTVSNVSLISLPGQPTAVTNSCVMTISDTTSVPFAGSGTWCFYNASTRNNHWAGPLYMGHTTTWGSGTNFISFADGTIPGTPASNTAALYGDDVNGTVNLFAINESSVTNQLSGLHIRKTADESVANNTIQDDNHIVGINLLASSAYEFEIIGFFTGAATAGIQVQLDGTVGVSSLKYNVEIFDATGASVAFARTTAFNTPTGVDVTGNCYFRIQGCIETSTVGNIRLEWAQNTTDAGNATTLQENSYAVFHKLNA